MIILDTRVFDRSLEEASRYIQIMNDVLLFRVLIQVIPWNIVERYLQEIIASKRENYLNWIEHLFLDCIKEINKVSIVT